MRPKTCSVTLSLIICLSMGLLLGCSEAFESSSPPTESGDDTSAATNNDDGVDDEKSSGSDDTDSDSPGEGKEDESNSDDQAQDVDDNLLTNPGFEAGEEADGCPEGWRCVTYPDDSGSFSADDEDVYRGDFAGHWSAGVESDGDPTALFVQQHPSEAGRAYEVSAWYRHEGLDSAPNIHVLFLDADEEILDDALFSGAEDAQGWNEIEAEALEAPSGTAYVRFNLDVRDTSGAVWWDEAALVDVTDSDTDDGDDDPDPPGDYDDDDWLEPYPDPPEDAQYVDPSTMQSVLGNLQPGDTMVLEDGEYDAVQIGGMKGTDSAPITIMAENERGAVVRGDGTSAALRLRNAGHLEIKGIHFENIERDAGSDTYGAMPGYVTGSSDITIWRNLFRKPNVYGNNAALKIGAGSQRVLVEENEVLDFHRNGITLHNTPNNDGTRENIVRRNYVNPRDTRWKGQRWGPNTGIACYRGHDNIVENNILEYTMENGENIRRIQNVGSGNKLLGNIVVNGKEGIANFYVDQTVRSAHLEDNLIIDPKQNGAFALGVRGYKVKNNTIVNPNQSGLTASERDNQNPSLEWTNNLVVGAGDYGYTISNVASFTSIDIDYSSGWNNGKGNWGSGTDGRTNVVEASDPGFDGAYFRVPDNSPYKGAGRDGEDVGANIVYRYENGQLTDEPLWHPETGEFPHGAIVDGVNDIDGHSAFDVHQRLNVSPQTLPEDY